MNYSFQPQLQGIPIFAINQCSCPRHLQTQVHSSSNPNSNPNSNLRNSPSGSSSNPSNPPPSSVSESESESATQLPNYTTEPRTAAHEDTWGHEAQQSLKLTGKAVKETLQHVKFKSVTSSRTSTQKLDSTNSSSSKEPSLEEATAAAKGFVEDIVEGRTP